MRRCRWADETRRREDHERRGGALASDPCAFIADVTLAVDAEVIAIGRPEDQDGRETS
jgi:hypothetical protein